MALPGHETPAPLGTRAVPCPFYLRGPRLAEDRRGEKVSVTLGFIGPFVSEWVGEKSQNISISKLETGSVETETFLEEFVKKQGGVFSTL